MWLNVKFFLLYTKKSLWKYVSGKYVAQKWVEDYLNVPWEIIVGIDVYRFEDHHGFKLKDELHEVLLESVSKPSNPTCACSQWRRNFHYKTHELQYFAAILYRSIHRYSVTATKVYFLTIGNSEFINFFIKNRTWKNKVIEEIYNRDKLFLFQCLAIKLRNTIIMKWEQSYCDERHLIYWNNSYTYTIIADFFNKATVCLKLLLAKITKISLSMYVSLLNARVHPSITFSISHIQSVIIRTNFAID